MRLFHETVIVIITKDYNRLIPVTIYQQESLDYLNRINTHRSQTIQSQCKLEVNHVFFIFEFRFYTLVNNKIVISNN